MTKAQQINQILSENLDPQVFNIEDESHQHAGPDVETHFKVTLVSAQFEGMNRVARHRKIYGLLAIQLNSGVHALALHLYSPQEWQKQSEAVPASPKCRGGE